MLKQINICFPGTSKQEIKIVDYGCNQGLSLFLLAALGYTNIYGADLPDSKCERLNNFTQEILGLRGKRFFDIHDNKIPFESNSMDFLISQTVVEHVEPSLLENYYAEAARVVRITGAAYIDVPIRENLYDPHTGLWFAHMLPRPLWLKIVGLLKGNERRKWAENCLFLRSGKSIRSSLGNYFGTVENVTIPRLVEAKTNDHFVGGTYLRSRRKFFSLLFSLPILGIWLAILLAPFTMMTLVAKRKL